MRDVLRILKLAWAAPLGLALYLFLFLPATPAQALTCPVKLPDKGIDCSTLGPEYSYCGTFGSGGQCLIESTVSCPNDAYGQRTRLDCNACGCSCPLDTAYNSSHGTNLTELDCVDLSDHSCQARDLTCQTTYFRQPVCDSQKLLPAASCGSCLSGYSDCRSSGQDACQPSTDPSCPLPDVWDPCTKKCTYKYVLANPNVSQRPQPAHVSLTGDLTLTGGGAEGNFYMANGRAIRVDGSGSTWLNLGNWDSGSTGLNTRFWGSIYADGGMSLIPGDDSIYPGTTPGNGVLEADEICLGDDIGCRESWPIGLPEFATEHATLRYDGAVWQQDTFLKNFQDTVSGVKRVGIGTALATDPGWTLDIRSSANDAIINLDDQNEGLWAGLRLGRKLGPDTNAERWFLGMPPGPGDNLVLQYGGDLNKRYLMVDSIGRIGIGTETPQTKVNIRNGQLRLSRDDTGDPTVQFTSTTSGRAWNLGLNDSDGSFRLSRSFANLNLPVLTAGGPNNHNVGISTDDPRFPLDVFGYSDTAVVRLVDDNGGETPDFWTGLQLARWPLSDKTGGLQPTEKWFVGMADLAGGGNKLLFRRNSSTNDMVIDTSGLVGIATSSPQTRLHVQNGDIRVESTSPLDSAQLQLLTQEGDNWVIGTDLETAAPTGGLMVGYRSDGSVPDLSAPHLAISPLGWLGLRTATPQATIDATNQADGTATTLRLNQDFAGHNPMGISLEEQGSEKWYLGMDNATENFNLHQGDVDVNRIVVDTAGRVGLGGTPNSAFKLDVSAGTDLGTVQMDAMRVTQDMNGTAAPVSANPADPDWLLGPKDASGDIIWVQKPLGLPRSGNQDGMTLRYSGSAASGSYVGTMNLYNSGTRVAINKLVNPAFPLEVTAAAGDQPIIRLHGPSSGKAWTGLRMDRPGGFEYNNPNGEKWFIGMDDSDEDLIFRSNGQNATARNALVLQQGGSLGLGDDTPASTLTVGNGDLFQVAGTSGHVSIGDATNPSANAGLRMVRTLNVTGADYGLDVDVQNTTADGGNNFEGARIKAQANAAVSALKGIEASAVANAAGVATVQGADLNVSVQGGSAPANVYGLDASVTASGGAAPGNVYGVNSVVNAPGTTGKTYAGYFSATGSPVQNHGVYSAAGNNYMRNWLAMGQGNDIPQYPIDIYSDGGNAVVRVEQPAAGTMRQGLKLDKGATESWFIGMEPSSDKLEFKTAGSTKLAVQADGKVGVGVDNPAYTLDVAGWINITGLRMAAQSYENTPSPDDDKVLATNENGEAYWRTVAMADDCTGGKFSHLSNNPPAGVVNGGSVDGNEGSYAAMNALCGFEPVSGRMYHVCYADEILRTIRCAPGALPGSGQAWVSHGPPGYTIPAVNDCAGWTVNNSLTTHAYGSFWQFQGSNGGVGYATSCNTVLPVACCTPL